MVLGRVMVALREEGQIGCGWSSVVWGADLWRKHLDLTYKAPWLALCQPYCPGLLPGLLSWAVFSVLVWSPEVRVEGPGGYFLLLGRLPVGGGPRAVPGAQSSGTANARSGALGTCWGWGCGEEAGREREGKRK